MTDSYYFGTISEFSCIVVNPVPDNEPCSEGVCFFMTRCAIGFTPNSGSFPSRTPPVKLVRMVAQTSLGSNALGMTIATTEE